MLFESHAHYDDEAFENDRGKLLESFKENDIEYVINIGASIRTTENTIALTKKYPFIYGAAGVHPSDTAELNEEKFAWLKEQCSLPKIVAVGEIGLDYYWDEPDREIQKKWFDRQLQMAREVKLPIIIHSRDAAKDTVDMMKAGRAEEAGGVIHCFSYTKETAREFLGMGFSFGIGGVITFNNAKKLREAVEYIPMENILLETDSPYLAPMPYRGKRNSSLYLPLIAEKIAEVKGISYEEVVEITSHNAKRLFQIS
ncbi:TatD DNase family protein [Kineothrix alysoides]|uniref:TatD DNase family protein n=1 Tax=Kineothrix alysoides TaxID=1469948 RepID=A0A4R1QKY0_9FIRM|nr:TatD family hydrolase [Kineothrix alysoides]TCL54266.1 TatD DNase family protein [Kineothrix alysoides]